MRIAIVLALCCVTSMGAYGARGPSDFALRPINKIDWRPKIVRPIQPVEPEKLFDRQEQQELDRFVALANLWAAQCLQRQWSHLHMSSWKWYPDAYMRLMVSWRPPRDFDVRHQPPFAWTFDPRELFCR